MLLMNKRPATSDPVTAIERIERRIDVVAAPAIAPPAPPVKKRSMLAKLCMTMVVVVVGLMVIVGVFAPSLCRSRETANRVKCASNLRQIGQAMLLYAEQNGGAFPCVPLGSARVASVAVAPCTCGQHHHADEEPSGAEILHGDGHISPESRDAMKLMLASISPPAR